MLLLLCCMLLLLQLTPEAKSNLRRFRSQAGIDAQEHLIAVEKQVSRETCCCCRCCCCRCFDDCELDRDRSFGGQAGKSQGLVAGGLGFESCVAA